MKAKDIIIIVVCLVVIGTCAYFLYIFFIPKAPTAEEVSQPASKIEFTGDIDQDTLNKVKLRNDYGLPAMDNIGRPNPFASL